MRLMTSRHAVHRLSSSDVTSCVTSYLQLVLVPKEMGWLAPTHLGLSDVKSCSGCMFNRYRASPFDVTSSFHQERVKVGLIFTSQPKIFHISLKECEPISKLWVTLSFTLLSNSDYLDWAPLRPESEFSYFKVLTENCYVNNANFMSPLRVVSDCSRGIVIMTLPH